MKLLEITILKKNIDSFHFNGPPEEFKIFEFKINSPSHVYHPVQYSYPNIGRGGNEPRVSIYI